MIMYTQSVKFYEKLTSELSCLLFETSLSNYPGEVRPGSGQLFQASTYRKSLP